MEGFLSDKEKRLIPELIQIAQQMTEKDVEHLLWAGEGILWAKRYGDERKGVRC